MSNESDISTVDDLVFTLFGLLVLLVVIPLDIEIHQ